MADLEYTVPGSSTAARLRCLSGIVLLALGLAAVPDSGAARTVPVPTLRSTPAAAVPIPVLRPSGTLGPRSLAVYRRAFALADKGRWRAVLRQHRAPVRPELERVLHGLRLADPASGTSFAEIVAFLDTAPFWPDRATLEIRAEDTISSRIPLARRLAWFAANPPRTAKGHLALAGALKQAERIGDWTRTVRGIWKRVPLNRTDTRRFLRAHGHALTQDMHWPRLDRMLWLGAISAARATMPLVDPDLRRLAEARLRLRQNKPNVDAAIRRVPRRLSGDPGLAYERLRWRGRKDRHDRVIDLLASAPKSPTYPSLWWKERRLQLRDALNGNRHSDAIMLAAGHRQSEGAALADAEWHAGWVALRFADRPREALDRFANMFRVVKTPISRGRAAYWAGRAIEASGGTGAREWYRRAAAYATTFYGQRAAERLSTGLELPASTPLPSRPRFARAELGQIAAIATALQQIGEDERAGRFLELLVRHHTSDEEAAATAALARDLRRPDIGVKLARRTARRHLHFLETGYPVLALPASPPVEPALVHAIIRQESSFDTGARSSAGALGLMQLLPATAREMARHMGRRFSVRHLTSKPQVNIRLGAQYVRRLLDIHHGNFILALAAYNAGPGRVRSWLRTLGRPGPSTAERIDWIERIPYPETRNYVQRVLEALEVYRRLLGSEAEVWTLQASTAAQGDRTSSSPS
ncbi:MAG: lytic transglycosylase domain-containing protein [Alphaproteobacteria bacterium]|nr:lytic transglycosylase domain-containing protein [Alphaproteobacteria bacterium]